MKKYQAHYTYFCLGCIIGVARWRLKAALTAREAAGKLPPYHPKGVASIAQRATATQHVTRGARDATQTQEL